jgi:ubiquitin-like 1-activating enzyme E1 A
MKTEQITTASKRSLNYPSLESIIDFDHNSPAFIKRMKKTGPAYIVKNILQKFREDEKRDPLPESRLEDIKKLQALRDEISAVETIPDVYFDHVFAQISPSAAIVGGAVGQEIIKTISQKEAPHYNHFFFDAQTSCGFIETIE